MVGSDLWIIKSSVVVKNIVVLNFPSLNVYKIQIAMCIMRTAQKRQIRNIPSASCGQ